MDGLGAVFFAIACGIAAAGLVSSLHQAIAGEVAGFRVPAGSALAVMWAVMLSLFAGPFFVISIALPAGMATRRFALRAVLGVMLALVWCFCSGVVVIQLLLLGASLAA
jgi:cytochrome c biogenesis protein CcdA